ncbi:MAG: hypothetical protein U1E65_24500 [Myxococcota bacterium]
MIGLALSLLAAPMIFVDPSVGVAAEDEAAVVDAYARIIAAQAGTAPEIVRPPEDCATGDACAIELATRRQAAPLFILRVIGAVTRIRAVVRTPEAGEAAVDLSPDPKTWGPEIERAIAGLWAPEAAAHPRLKAPELRLGPWLTLAGAAALAGGSIGLRAASLGEQDALAGAGRTSDDTLAIARRASGLGAASDILLASAIGGVLTAVVWWAIDR